MTITNNYGIQAENYFASEMNRLGLNHKFINSWYDFIVEGKMVEVKSCNLSVKQVKNWNNKKFTEYRTGRFDFTNKDNRELQSKNNIWICFILRNNNDFMILGFTKARQLKKKRYICVHRLQDIKIISFNEWVCKICKLNKKKK